MPILSSLLPAMSFYFDAAKRFPLKEAPETADASSARRRIQHDIFGGPVILSPPKTAQAWADEESRLSSVFLPQKADASLPFDFAQGRLLSMTNPVLPIIPLPSALLRVQS